MRTWQLEKEFQDRGATWKSNCEEKKLSKEQIISQIKMHVAAFLFTYKYLFSISDKRRLICREVTLSWKCAVYTKNPKKNNLCFNWKPIILACPNALWQLCVSYCFSVISGRRQQAGEMPNKWDHNSFKKIIPPNSHLKVTDSQNCSLFYLHKKVLRVKVDLFCRHSNITLQCCKHQ